VKEGLRKLLLGLAVDAIRRPAPKPLRPGERERIVPDGPPEPRGELLALALLGFGTVCAIAFVAVYVTDRIPNQTQFLGLSLGLALTSFAAALIVTAKKLIVTEELEEDYPAEEHPEEQQLVVQTVHDSGSRLTRRTLFKLGLGTAGGALGVALLTPLASLGPVIDMDPFYGTPWKGGRRLVDENGRPWRAGDIEEKDFYTAFPEGADREQLGSAVVVIRLAASDFKLPKEIAAYPAHGIAAFSKICTHAGCAISLYRTPLFPPYDPAPALVCPCHYSTFDPATGGTVTFGPAGRKLPMLPLYVDGKGHLRAAGNFDEPVGPSWWGVRLRKPSP